MKALLELEKNEEFTKNFNYAFLPTYNYSYAAFNLKPDGIKHKKFFNDTKVRRALAMLTPINDMNKVAYANKAERAVGPVPLLKKEYNKDLKPIEFDLEGAKKLLAEAGWKDGDGDGILEKMVDGEKLKFEFNYTYMNTAPSWKDMAQLMSESFAKAGVKANLEPVDFNVMQDKVRNHDFDMFILAWQSSTAPDDHEQIWATNSWATKGSNFTGWGSAASDALIDSMKYELDDAKRTAMSHRFQKMVYDDQPYVFIFTSTRRVCYNKKYGQQETYYDKPGLLLNYLKLGGSSSSLTTEN
jgi:peptide/nickel transport system substrate-binding protein